MAGLAAVESYSERGCIVFDKLFPPSLIDAAHAEYQRQYDRIDLANPPPHMNVGDQRLHLPLQLRGALLDPELYAHPILMLILSKLLNSDFLIDSAICVTALPGAKEQRFHRDLVPLFAEDPPLVAKLPAFAITLVIPLIDLDEDTGTTKLYPGSLHAMIPDIKNPPSGMEELCPYVKRGGCFLMDYRLYHRGLANRSGRDRPMLFIVYAREWFTDIANYKKHSRLVVSREAAMAIPIEHRPKFQRIAAQGLHDMAIDELLGPA